MTTIHSFHSNISYYRDKNVDITIYLLKMLVGSTTKYMPYELLFGTVPNIPNSFQSSVDPLYNYDDYSKNLKFRMQNLYEIAKQNILKSKENSKIFTTAKNAL